jgi:hypothetical protein
MIGRVKVYRFRLYDIANDDFKIPARRATRAFIKRVGGDPIRSTRLEIGKKDVNADETISFFFREEQLAGQSTTRPPLPTPALDHATAR